MRKEDYDMEDDKLSKDSISNQAGSSNVSTISTSKTNDPTPELSVKPNDIESNRNALSPLIDDAPILSEPTMEQVPEDMECSIDCEGIFTPTLCPYCHQELKCQTFRDGTSAYIHKVPNDRCNRIFETYSDIIDAEDEIEHQKKWEEEKASLHERILCPICNHRLFYNYGDDGKIIYYDHTYHQQEAEHFHCNMTFYGKQEIIEIRQQINRQIREKITEYLRWSNYYRSSPKNDHELVCPYCRKPMYIARNDDQCFIVHNIHQLNNSCDSISAIVNVSPCQAIFSDITDLVQVERIRRKLSDVSLLPLCPLCGEPLEAFVTNGKLEFHHNSSNHHCRAMYKGNMTSIEQARLALVTMDMEVDPKPEEPDRNSPDYPDELVAWYKETTDKILQEAREKEAAEAKKEEANETDISEDIDDWSQEESEASTPWYKKLFGFHAKK